MAQLTTDDYISLYASPGTNNSTYILLNYTSDGERKSQNFLKCSARDVVYEAERKFEWIKRKNASKLRNETVYIF